MDRAIKALSDSHARLIADALLRCMKVEIDKRERKADLSRHAKHVRAAILPPVEALLAGRR